MELREGRDVLDLREERGVLELTGRMLALRLILVSGSSLSGCVVSNHTGLLNPFGSVFFFPISKMGKIILLMFC